MKRICQILLSPLFWVHRDLSNEHNCENYDCWLIGRHRYIWMLSWLNWLIDLFICFESHEQFFSYLATVIITGDKAANLDLCLALTAYSSEGSFSCHTYCDTGPPFLRSYQKDPWFSLLNAVLLAKEQSLLILNVFDAAGSSGARTHDLRFAKRIMVEGHGYFFFLAHLS
jgi:hypothetical protein